MNRVITINLNGNAYQLEESAYDALRIYLDDASRRLESNPDREEIIADIEQAIAEKFRMVLGPAKSVVVTREVEAVLAQMGPVQDASAADSPEASASGGQTEKNDRAARESKEAGRDGASFKRLYAIREGAMLAGVCNGLAAYFNLDVTIVRILFVILCLFWGMGLLLYGVMAFIVPTAETSEEKAAAHGVAHTAQEFIRRAKAGYYEGMKSFNDKQARREWKRKFKQEMRGWRQNFRSEMDGASRQQWAQSRSYHRGVNPAWSLLWLINAAITLTAFYAIYSLVVKHEVFGLTLPAGMPLWIGIVLLVILWRALAAPFRIMERGGYAGRGCTRRGCGPMGGVGDFLVGIGFLVLTLWLLDRYVPAFHEVLKTVPPVLHQAVDSVQQWLDRR